ncbi:hypothetical protein M8C21_000768 [Ambrosia artemisiifolia]|uniref:Rnh202 triple barrel domain-containing protein n=1 Tax=Ambrosia artemisiifolia TaxID=4212 RepID=A0AAD5CN01_AMBAR|nr:hypothetical protein M8C21_000768 [Ambrosia artemisiifolia]
MAWYDGLQDTRVLVASSDSSATGDDKGCLLQLRHPKTGDSTSYLLINGGLQELNWLKQSYGSWFMGDYICEDGGLYAATPVDPVFILLPMFDQARMKNGNDPGKFRQLDEIIYLQDYPGYRYVQQLKQTLVKLDKNYAARSEKEILADVVMILGEYLPDDPWCKVLCDNLRLNMVDVVDASDMKIDMAYTSVASSFNPTVQEPTGNDKRVTRSGKQNKKTKIETNSHSIKDMFSRASRRGK